MGKLYRNVFELAILHFRKGNELLPTLFRCDVDRPEQACFEIKIMLPSLLFELVC